MDTYRAILTKRDIRTFADRPIPDDVLRKILNAGRMSGSSRNNQPWHFVVVRDRGRLKTLAGFGRFAQHVATAAAAICIVLDSPRAAFDGGRCAQNIMLGAWNFGIGSCPASMHRHDEARAFLRAPESHAVITVVSLGYPHAKGRGAIERTALRILAGRGRRPLASMVSWEHYGAGSPGI
ncbi:MAG: nitroreductase family protein [bacterium]